MTITRAQQKHEWNYWLVKQPKKQTLLATKITTKSGDRTFDITTNIAALTHCH